MYRGPPRLPAFPTPRPPVPSVSGSLQDAIGVHLELLGRTLRREECIADIGEDTAEASALRAALERFCGDLRAPVRFSHGAPTRDEGPLTPLDLSPAPPAHGARRFKQEDLHPGDASMKPPAGREDKSEQDACPSLEDANSVPDIPSSEARISRTASSEPQVAAIAGSADSVDTQIGSAGSGPPAGRGRKQHKKFQRHATEFDDTRHKLGRFAHRLVVSPRFEVAVSIVIIVNCVIMLSEEQLDGAMLGHQLAFYSYYGSEEWAAGVPFDLFYYLEIIFAVIFTLEVILRMIGFGTSFWRKPTEYFDLAVVVLSNLSIVADEVVTLPFNVQLLRLIRSAKLLRLIKLLRTMEGFDPLHLMTTALKSSCWALFWSALLLFATMTFIAMLITNVFQSVYLPLDSALTDEQRLEVFAYFGTFARSLLTLFEMALANWAPACRFLMENVHEAWLLFVLVFKLVMGFAVIGVLNAVFMQETFKVAHTDDDIMVRQKARALSLHKRKMQELFEMADSDGNGRLNLNEFRAVIADPSIKMWLSSMDLDASDADLLFELLSGDDGLIDKDELIHGITLVRGPARSLDMRYLMKVWQIDERDCMITNGNTDPSVKTEPARRSLTSL